MVSLLLSGLSSVFVVTITGQMVSEGHINWSFKPWIRRLITRLITIIPTLAISLSIGRDGLSKALNASQVILSVLLPFIIAPVIYFTSFKKYMKSNKNLEGYKDFSNNWIVAIVAGILWVFISCMNVYGIVQAAKDGI
ncbi:unnamed protein product [Ambrosiozyma monospora]|uniref:Unnamed protein product n=1 Tax=Ambrosiozyma monospora TaxID=43982 RepID=A0ACB5T3N2_AMBMO|nr:unnamed protein product [Ambrosiozyma monospora]